jgi:hypothetical protein
VKDVLVRELYERGRWFSVSKLSRALPDFGIAEYNACYSIR